MFGMYAIEFEPKSTLVELDSLDNVYNLKSMEIWQFLTENPYESLIDTEDQEFRNNF